MIITVVLIKFAILTICRNSITMTACFAIMSTNFAVYLCAILYWNYVNRL